MRDGKDIIAESVVSVGTGTRGPKEVFQNVLNQADVTVDQIDRILATGYGRMGFEQAAREVSEISCHARGVHYLVPTAGTIIDIGGQDAKAIRVDSNGSLDDFIMNDKCAAGTGRFLKLCQEFLISVWKIWAKYPVILPRSSPSAAPVLFLQNPKSFPACPTMRPLKTLLQASIAPLPKKLPAWSPEWVRFAKMWL